MPDTLESLRRAMLAARGPLPLITYYDASTGERVELSNLSTDNWVAKTANLMADLGVAEGDRVGVDLPDHWQTAVWLLACWASAATVDPTGEQGSAALLVTHLGGPAVDRSAAGEVAVCSLRPMGLPLEEPPPPGITDYALEVRTHGDRYAGPPPAPQDAAVSDLPHAAVIELAGSLARDRGLAAGSRLLHCAGSPPLWQSLAVTLVLGGSLVMVTGAVDAHDLQRIEAAERVDARLRA